MKGYVILSVDGKVVFEGPNLMTVAGRAYVVDKFINGNAKRVDLIGVGANLASGIPQAVVPADTALFQQIGPWLAADLIQVCVNLDTESPLYSNEMDAIEATATFTAATRLTIRELGLASSVAGVFNTLVAHLATPPITLEEDQSMQIQWRIIAGGN